LSLVLARFGLFWNVDNLLLYIIERDTPRPQEGRINLFVASVLA
jgi:hypothetical protein